MGRFEVVDYNGWMWCIKVQTGAFVARRNGCVFVTGNSGFPKSHNIGKAIDKMAGAEREVIGRRARVDGAPRNYEAWKPHQTGSMAGTLAEAGSWETAPVTEAARRWEGWGTALKPAWEPIIVARKPFSGTVAANVLEHGTGALNVDACRVEGGRWPANLLHDGSEEVVAGFPQANHSTGGRFERSGEGWRTGDHAPSGYADTGSAARFFYCAKASKADRDAGLGDLPEATPGERTGREDGSAGITAYAGTRGPARNIHPTVKPTDLMRYLCRLVTPPDGVVLDPFMGSGSTGRGAVLEGFRFVGIDVTPEYVEIARRRIAEAEQRASKERPGWVEVQPDLFGGGDGA